MASDNTYGRRQDSLYITESFLQHGSEKPTFEVFLDWADQAYKYMAQDEAEGTDA